MAGQGMASFDKLESAVRSYCRTFPAVFTRAAGSTIYDELGRPYLDFFSGAGALNYGHNPPHIKRRLIDYLESDGIAHSLDMATAAKREFLDRFVATILVPRELDYRVQFPGPTGTNAVEAALKLARKVTGRQVVAFFTDAFHGLTLGSLSVNGDPDMRRSAGVPLGHTLELPYDGDLATGVESGLDVLEEALTAGASERPAAVIVETVQAEGGVKVASRRWLRGWRS
jgi:diaminobutyrate-2-oxoglutarate transaminase